MKKALLILAALTAFVSCYKEGPVIDTDPAEINPENIIFNVTVGELGPDTKTVKTSWKKGDIIWGWVNGNYNESPDIKITYDGEKWTVALFRPGCTFKDGGKIVAIFEGENNINGYEFSEDFFETSTGMGIERKVLFDTRDGETCYQYPMIAACESTYSYDLATSNPRTSNIVTIHLNNWEFLTSIQIVIPGLEASEAKNYTLTCPQLSPCRSQLPKSGNDTKCLSISIPLIKFHEAKQTKGKANLKSGNFRPNASWVQLWENGPKFAEFNVGSSVEPYNQTAKNPDAAKGSVKYYNQYNVGGLYPRNNPYYDARESQYWHANECGDPNKDVATEIWRMGNRMGEYPFLPGGRLL